MASSAIRTTPQPGIRPYEGVVALTDARLAEFENGVPKRQDYRKFKIKTVAGPDDYAMLRERRS